MPETNGAIWSKIKTGLAVSSITLLIWLAADQNVAIDEEFTVSVRLTSPEQDRYAGFAEAPYQRTFTVKMKGRRNRLREFGRLVDSGEGLLAVIDRSTPTSSDPRTLNVADDILSRVKEIRESRLTVLSVDPENADVIVDRYTTIHDVRVKPDYGELRVTPEFLRVTVSARVPRFIRRMLGDAPIARAEPKQSIQQVNRPDGSFEVAGILSFDILDQLDPNLKIDFEPSNEVTIAGRIEAMTSTESKGPIQINWAVPDEVQRDYTLVTDQVNFRVYIDVTGPRERVTQLDPRRIRAYIDVFAGDVDSPGPNKEIVREVRFILPRDADDCTIAPGSQTYQVRFRLEPRPHGVPSTVGAARPAP